MAREIEAEHTTLGPGDCRFSFREPRLVAPNEDHTGSMSRKFNRNCPPEP